MTDNNDRVIYRRHTKQIRWPSNDGSAYTSRILAFLYFLGIKPITIQSFIIDAYNKRVTERITVTPYED